MRQSTHAIHHRAARMLCARNVTEPAHVYAYRNTLVIHIRDAVLNVCRTLNVIARRPASIINARILAPVFVASMQVSIRLNSRNGVKLKVEKNKNEYEYFLLPVCRSQNHAPKCYCDVDFVGDPNVACHPKPGMLSIWISHNQYKILCSSLHLVFCVSLPEYHTLPDH